MSAWRVSRIFLYVLIVRWLSYSLKYLLTYHVTVDLLSYCHWFHVFAYTLHAGKL